MIPTQKADLEAMGYVFDNEASCRGCGQQIEWWITPKDKKMPMSVVEVRKRESPISPILRIDRVPHWSNCPNADDFRKRR